MWEQLIVETERGQFEVFVSGSGEPLCVTHLYSEFNELGNYFADMFLDSFRVYLVNLKNAGKSSTTIHKDELSMKETVKDLDAIRRALDLEMWSFAGHSTGGMLGLVYGFSYPHILTRLLVGGASATNRYMGHKDSIYSQSNPNHKRLKEILSILTLHTSTRSEERRVGKERK